MNTIRDVAKAAGVSVASVSHVLNKTRYVSPEIERKVKKAIDELQYVPIRKTRKGSIENTVGVIVPELSVPFYAMFSNFISSYFEENNIRTVIIDSCGEDDKERLELAWLNCQSKVNALVLFANSDKIRMKTFKLKKPCLIVGEILEKQNYTFVLPDYENAAFEAASHLIRSGHVHIALILQDYFRRTSSKEYGNGFRSALRHYRIREEDNIFFEKDLQNDIRFFESQNYTAVICATSKIVHRIMFYLNKKEKTCPDDLSIVSLEREMPNTNYQTFITEIGAKPDELAKSAGEILMKIMRQNIEKSRLVRLPCKASFSDSVKIIGKGPFGDILADRGNLYLTEEEIRTVQEAQYKGALLFHFNGKRWMRLVNQAVCTVFEKLNIKLLDTFDADSNNQAFIEKVREIIDKRPDFILCAPANDKSTELLYQDIIKKGIKLIFIGRVPQGVKRENYESCIISNELESGYNCAKILNDYFKGKDANIGFLTCSSNFISGKDRDTAAKKMLEEQFSNLHIIAHEKFTLKNYAYGACVKMVKENPSIQAIYVTWEDPAIQVMAALMDLGREDIKVVTCDLDTEVAQDIANDHLMLGVSAQMPYALGEEAAYAAVNVLLEKKISKVIGVPPMLVTAENLEEAWYVMTKEKIPRSILITLEASRVKQRDEKQIKEEN